MKDNEHFYYSIYEEFKTNILEGKLVPGDKLDSERNLSEKYNVSRNTIRATLNLLEKEGYVFKVQGKGNFVASQKMNQNLNTFYSFYENIKSAGKKPKSEIVSHKIIEANFELSEIFRIPLNSKIIYFERLRFMNEEPIIFEQTYLPMYRFNGFDPLELNNNSMYNIFENRYDVTFSKAIETLKPILISSKKEKTLLKLKDNDLGMSITRSTYEKEKIIEYTISSIKNNVFEYSITLNKGW
ncbi:GntR family transcriptional regulator [Streptobacillus felis]|uniref:GntR family transcriptional regulator n=1 Tax=Streptobacillus felis TaxID=1384509 RepID=A0A7Z0PHQ6_9FUSO|nr:GntR family transcriptional regulator [Streptobacillus felis]NYV28440.1 GntR family transcriptional regulator [Streptobacillus felis]